MKMNNYENDYKLLVKKILDTGEIKNGRNGKTISIFGESLTVDISGGFPLLTSRKMHYKGVLGELAAMLRGPKHVNDFKEFGCNYWGDWADADGSLRLDYGNLWMDFNGVNQFEQLLDTLRNNPYDRRMVISGWNPANLDKLSLPCCHMLYQWHVDIDGKLNMIWYQRSVDTMIGLPSDVVFATAWNILIANEVGYTPGKITFMLGDTHIYEEHINGAKQYLDAKTFKLPTYTLLAAGGEHTVDFTPDMLVIDHYNHGEQIKFLLKS